MVVVVEVVLVLVVVVVQEKGREIVFHQEGERRKEQGVERFVTSTRISLYE